MKQSIFEIYVDEKEILVVFAFLVKQTGADDQKRFMFRLVNRNTARITFRVERRFTDLAIYASRRNAEYDVADGFARHRRGKHRAGQPQQKCQCQKNDSEIFFHIVM
ncbi:MAG: hypothetical protein J6Y54_01705 [Lentisphaeria bacterium]|nr:hypothetical protein [Lentisphaeria bacterium]